MLEDYHWLDCWAWIVTELSHEPHIFEVLASLQET